MGDLYAVMTDLHKVQQQAAHLRDAIHNERRSLTPKLLDKSAPKAGLNGDQGWAEVLGIHDDLTKLSTTPEEESRR